MILVDTSAWVEFLRATGGTVHQALRSAVASGAGLATTEVVVMELLAGARDEAHLGRLRRLVLGCNVLPVIGLIDYEDAAAIYRRCLRHGETIRSLTDCLIAAVAMRADAEVLHADRDYTAIARHTSLRIAAVTRGT